MREHAEALFATNPIVTTAFALGTIIRPISVAATSEKGLALPRASRSGEIALAGSRRRRSTLVVFIAPGLRAHAIVTAAKIGITITP